MDRKNTARGARFLLGFSMYLILAQTDGVYLILAYLPIFLIASESFERVASKI